MGAMDMGNAASGWIYGVGLHHILAAVISLVAAYVGLRASFQFGGSIGKAIRWFCLGLVIITFPHTLEFLTVTVTFIPLERDMVRLLKAISYIASACLFVYSFYLLKTSAQKVETDDKTVMG